MRQPLIIPIRHDDNEVYQNIELYEWDHAGRRFAVPVGMVCDGASVPRLAWIFMPPDGLHRAAALPHDQIFGSGHVIDGYRFTLWESDMLFLKRMREAGVHPVRANFAWAGLKLGSWYAWKKSENSELTILPVRNAFVSKKRPKTVFSRHIYAEPSAA